MNPRGYRDRHGHPSPWAHRLPDELTVLMELRLAFGPGTRLWAQRSREDLCYDWLRYKAQDVGPNFRQFALKLYSREAADSPGRGDLLAIRRRVAAVLRNYHIKKKAVAASVQPAQAAAPRRGIGTGPVNGATVRAVPTGAEVSLVPHSLEIRGTIRVETDQAPR